MTVPAAAATPVAPAPAAREVAVRVSGLTKRFQVRRSWMQMVRHPWQREWTTSLDRVSCEIHTGEFFGLLGPNGAGKTTLFKILATLVAPDEGTATVHGLDVLRNEVGVRGLLTPVLTNERSLHWRLTARENLEYYATMYGLSAAETRRRVDEVLATVELADTGSKPTGKFSSGMKQRLMIARALLTRPKVLLLDEPTRSLDPISARSFRRFLRDELVARQGCTVILATHSAEEALNLCDRVGVLHRGRMLAVGSAAELSRQLADERFVLWTKEPGHPALASLVERGVALDPATREADVPGWWCVELTVPGGLDRAAQALDVLTCAGMRVARFEQVTLSLADLIERTVQRRGGADQHA